MTSRPSLPPVPLTHPSEAEHRRRIASTLNALLRDEGQVVRWDDLRVPLETAKLTGTSDPVYGKILESSVSSIGVCAYKFSPSRNEEVFFSVQLPHGYAEGTDLKPHVHWLPLTSAAGQVAFGLEWTLTNIDGTFGSTHLHEGTISALGAFRHQYCPLATISAGGIEVSAMLIGRLYRQTNGVANHHSATVAVLEIDFHIQEDARGSQSERKKWVTP